MRKLAIAALFLSVSPAWAQSVSVGEAIEPLAPGITVRVIRESPRNVNGHDVCSLPLSPPTPIPWECGGSPYFPGGNFTIAELKGAFTIGVDASGNAYHVGGSQVFTEFGNGRSGNLLRRVSPAGVMEDVAHVLRRICVSQDCRQKKEFNPQGLIIDVTSGRIWVTVEAKYIDLDVPLTISNIGTVEIGGLPTIQDVIPVGPPGPPGASGPPGPPGQQGPPGTPADMSRVLGLEQQVAAQQAMITALRTTLDEIAGLPTIRTLLERVQRLEQTSSP